MNEIIQRFEQMCQEFVRLTRAQAQGLPIDFQRYMILQNHLSEMIPMMGDAAAVQGRLQRTIASASAISGVSSGIGSQIDGPQPRPYE